MRQREDCQGVKSVHKSVIRFMSVLREQVSDGPGVGVSQEDCLRNIPFFPYCPVDCGSEDCDRPGPEGDSADLREQKFFRPELFD